MKKILITILIICISPFLIIWGSSILKCEILTYRYGNQFSTIYRENTMIGNIDYLKVLNYSDSEAQVYYVSENRSGGNILSFVQQNNIWKYDKWERTVWSKTGSADGFIWPYIR